MIDDLIIKGVEEPYRMFTSRSEYRMTIRSDNADLRLTEKGREAGIVSDERWALFEKTKSAITRASELLHSLSLSPQGWAAHGFDVRRDGAWRSAFDMLRNANLCSADFVKVIPELATIDPHILSRIDVDGRYNSHLRRQEADLRTFMNDESLALDPRIDYSVVTGLSYEVRERLSAVRPTSIGAAKRIDGMTPTSIVYLLQFAKRTRGRLKESEMVTVA